ncbi:hypothetical protein PVK06_040240 [Gossypium arboreum]|uniref:Uncharacterized protein n=1 Tax=Gossypium arboreum TaxID=29729 RepID=A0ABR0N5P9_GOSAR|nr:hypothetical protein PVK06_040240 [Gossypium arboreum]
MAYFIDCCRCDEMPLLAVFQRLYQLKAHNRRKSSGLYYFTLCKDVEFIIFNKCSNLRLNRSKYNQVKCTTRNTEDSLEESTSLSREIDEYVDVRASMLDTRKKRRTNIGDVNVVLSSEEEKIVKY